MGRFFWGGDETGPVEPVPVEPGAVARVPADGLGLERTPKMEAPFTLQTCFASLPIARLMDLPLPLSLSSRGRSAALGSSRPSSMLSSWRPLGGGVQRRPLVIPAALASVVLSAVIGTITPLPSGAAPTPDLRPYPPAAPGERRWLISVDGTVEAAPGTGTAADQRVEIIVGRTLTVDCNRHLLQGSLLEESVPGWGFPMFRVKGGSQLVSTRMACPGQAPRREFVVLGGTPVLVPVNPRLPIAVVAPKELEVRWRLWRAEPRQQNAKPF